MTTPHHTPQQHTDHTATTPDILAELGLLDDAPPTPTTDAPEAQPHHERRQLARLPTNRSVRLVMLNGDTPLGEPFTATATDVSRRGIRLTGHAPLLTGARAAIQLTPKHDKAPDEPPSQPHAILGATVRHSTFGSTAPFTHDNATTAGLEFHALPKSLIKAHFTHPDGSTSIEPKPAA